MKRIILAIVAVFAVQANVFSADNIWEKEAKARKAAAKAADRAAELSTAAETDTYYGLDAIAARRRADGAAKRLAGVRQDARIAGAVTLHEDAHTAEVANMNLLQKAIAIAKANPKVVAVVGSVAATAVAILSSYLMFS